MPHVFFFCRAIALGSGVGRLAHSNRRRRRTVAVPIITGRLRAVGELDERRARRQQRICSFKLDLEDDGSSRPSTFTVFPEAPISICTRSEFVRSASTRRRSSSARPSRPRRRCRPPGAGLALPRRRWASSHEPPPAASIALLGMPVTPPLPAPSPKPPRTRRACRSPSATRSAPGSASTAGSSGRRRRSRPGPSRGPRRCRPSGRRGPPARRGVLAAPSAGAAKSDASSSDDTAAAVDAAASGSMPVSAEPPTTLSSRSSARLGVLAEGLGFALSVDTVLNTRVVAAADVPVPTGSPRSASPRTGCR